jgi:serine/threonine protein kinase
MEHAIMCPQCNAPLTPHRFARTVVCAYCGATVQLSEGIISAERFHTAYRAWNSPQSYQFSSWLSIGEAYWAMDRLIARGRLADVYAGQRARWPTELVVIKVLREPNDASSFENEWKTLQLLQKSEARGAGAFSYLLPQPVMSGTSTGGAYIGQKINIFRWASGFQHTLEDVIRQYPEGIPPRASIWVWRRILEILSFIHASGMAHGAVLPSNLLLQKNEHGIRLVGYSQAGIKGSPLSPNGLTGAEYYPDTSVMVHILSDQLDVVMSARCIITMLGGKPSDGSMPAYVPGKLAEYIRRIALAKSGDPVCQSAWAVREDLGRLADEIFGPPVFMPIEMPE